MLGIIIVTHGQLGESLIETARIIFNEEPEAVVSVSINLAEHVDKLRQKIEAAIKSVNSNKGILILTDMFGGTPSNLAISVMEPGRIDVVAGVNLPMLIKLASVREEKTLDEAVTSAQDAGRKYITVASRVLAGK